MNWKKEILGKLRFPLAVLKKFNADHGFLLSSGITFNLLICTVPLILLLLALAGTYLYSSQEILNHLRNYMENIFPSLDPRITKNLLIIIDDRKIVGILGLGGLLWTSTWFFGSLRTALNIVFQVEMGRSLLRGKVIDLLMILFAGIFLLMSMTLTSIVTFLQRYRLPFFIDLAPLIPWILKYVVPFYFTFWMCFLVYKIIPNRKIHWMTTLQAALFTSLFWELSKHLFGWYVLHLGRFSMVYGSLSTLAIFFLWVYYSSAILLLGGEVACLLEKQRTEGLP